MRSVALIAWMMGVWAAAPAWGQTVVRDPHIGYVYPAGGQRGTTVQILIGGQHLGGVTGVHLTGHGITGKVVEHYRPVRNLQPEQRFELGNRMAACAQARWDEMLAAGQAKGNPPFNLTRKPKPLGDDAGDRKVPRHYLFNGWEEMSYRELAYTRQRIYNRAKQQPNVQIGEAVLVELSIDADAAPGDREIRLLGKGGITNPMVFQVGTLPETKEIESNDPRQWDPLPPVPPLDLPVVINGQILPGDVDRICFSAKAGEPLIVKVQARHLVPFYADAVPGWFQAVVAIYDAEGNELAYADDYQFDPDPVLRFVPPADGAYALEIRDAIYRGREDFVYRVSLGKLPFITSMFPLGGQVGRSTQAAVTGWNLPGDTITLTGEVAGKQSLVIDNAVGQSNPVVYVLDTQPGLREAEPNDSTTRPMPLKLPALIDGRIDRPGDVDVYQFAGKAGQRVTAEVIARRLRSPMDSLIRLTDADGKVIAWNDDDRDKQEHLHRTYGTLTHQADSHLTAALPADGRYFLAVSDATRHGGPAYAYRLRLSEPKPDYDVFVGPSSITTFVGRSAPLSVHVVRREGFEGPVSLVLIDPPKGFALDRAVVPAGADHVRITLTVPTTRLEEPVTLKIEAHAVIDDVVRTRSATPADNIMQAFLWRHLVPAEQMVVMMGGPKRSGPAPKLLNEGVLRICPGSQAVARFKVPVIPKGSKVKFSLNDPPVGLSLASTKLSDGEVALTLAADKEVKIGQAGNLIVDVALETARKNKDGKMRKWVRPAGSLRAIPFAIVE
jgi:hypothetical protein